MKTSFKIVDNNSYKIGVSEIEGLAAAMKEVLKPVTNEIKSHAYWLDSIELTESEYKSRDGFYAHSHNLGGIEISEIIPECENYNFSYLKFGEPEFDPATGESDDNGEGHYDAKLRVWLKLESIEDNTLKFYLYMGGGNGDAPYFRTKYEETVFEAEFNCKSVNGLKRAAAPHIKKLLKVMRGAK